MFLDLVLINVVLMAVLALLPGREPGATAPRQAGRKAAKAALREGRPPGLEAGSRAVEFLADWSESFLHPRSLRDLGKVFATAALATLLSGSAVATVSSLHRPVEAGTAETTSQAGVALELPGAAGDRT